MFDKKKKQHNNVRCASIKWYFSVFLTLFKLMIIQWILKKKKSDVFSSVFEDTQQVYLRGKVFSNQQMQQVLPWK